MRKKEIVFDSEKRKNFLSGFRKRKNERRARAKEELERNIKEERKRIRNDVKNSMAKMKKTFQPLVLDPEIEEKCLEKEYEDDEVEINVIELAPKNIDLDEDCDSDSNASEAADKGSNINSIPGMEFSVEAVEKEKKEKKVKPEDNTLSELGKIGNKKMLDKFKKKKALKEIKKSKIFKQKERADKKKQHKTRRDLKHSKSNSNGTKSKHNRFKRGHASGRGRRR